MHNQLIIEAFKKAKKETGSRKKVRWSEHLSDYISENSNDTFTERSLRTYYDRIQNDDKTHIELKSFVVDALLKYLDYPSFRDFLNRNDDGEKDEGSSLIQKMRNKKTAIFTSALIVLLSYIGYDAIKKDCMTWEKDHFEKVRCDESANSRVVPFNKQIFQNMKMVQPDCNYPFFKSDGTENLWYGKSPKGELQFFTYYGLHPLSGNTLDPITDYMINKYICNDK